MSMSLGQARRAYSKALVRLLSMVESFGLEFAFDQGKVPEEGSVHMPGSLHLLGLATDILLYRNETYLTDTADYNQLGEAWESLGVELNLPLAWGGRFTKQDGNHFSMKYLGKA